MEQPAPMAPLVRKVRPVHKATLDHRVLKEFKAILVRWVQKVLKAQSA